MEYEIMKGNGYCRGCDAELDRGVHKALKMYSFRNRGQHILLCKDCVNRAYKLVNYSVHNSTTAD